MSRAWRYMSTLVAALVIAAAAVFAQTGGNPKAEIEKANAAFGAAIAKGDAAAIARMYSSDAEVYPPNSEPIKGGENIRKVWQGVIDSGIKAAQLRATEVVGHGDMLYEVGAYSMSAADGKMADRGKYIVIWKRENGAWKLHRDIWNTNMPPAK